MYHKKIWTLLLGTILCSYLFPTPGTIIKPYISHLLILLMTLSCLKINPLEIKKAMFTKQVYLITTLTILISPLIAWTFKPLLKPEEHIGLLIASAIPAGITIIYISELYKGKTAQALSITTISHLLSILTIPLILTFLAKETIHLNPTTLLLTLLKFIILPFTLAQFLRKTLLNYQKQVFTLSTITLLTIIYGVVAPTKQYIQAHPKVTITIAFISAICIIIPFLIGWIIGKNTKEKITYSIAASYKNYTLSTVLALTLFGETAALPSIIYTILNNILFAILDIIIKK